MRHYRVVQHGKNRFQLQVREWVLFIPLWNDVGHRIFRDVVMYQKTLEEALQVMREFEQQQFSPQIVYDSAQSKNPANSEEIAG